MARSLNELKEKKEWKWMEEYQKTFKELKNKITSQLMLFLPKKEGKFRVETDTSGYAIEGACYEPRSLGLDNRTTLVLSNTRELDRELFYELVYLI